MSEVTASAPTSALRPTYQCLHCGITMDRGEFCCSACQILYNHFKEQRQGRSFQEQKNLQARENPYAYLDQPNFRNYFEHQNKDYNFLFYVEGLHCSSCVHLIEKLPLYIDGIMISRVQFGASLLMLRVGPEAKLSEIALLLKDWGYNPSPIAPEDDLSSFHKKENRKALMRIAVAGAVTGNIMLFVIPIYGGLVGDLGRTFHWICFFLYLPILFYSAIPFYVGAWNSVRYRVINVDLPITIAMLTSIGFSTVNLLRGDPNVYFDSTASFMFLILSARYLLKRVQQSYLSNANIKNHLSSDSYRKITASGEIQTATIQEISAGDELLLNASQLLPGDGVVKSGLVVLDTSLFDGESVPKTYHKGMKVFAGCRVLTPESSIVIEAPFGKSRLGKILQALRHEAIQKSQFIGVTDKLAQWLIGIVLSSSVLFFVFYSQVDITEAFNRSLALIVLACPCALALGSPLAYGLALKKAQEMGILIRDSSVLEKIPQIKNILFDKTGTLTTGELKLEKTEPQELSDEVKSLILGLEQKSYHPIAFTLREAWKNIPPKEFPKTEEILGKGVCGKLDLNQYEISTDTGENQSPYHSLQFKMNSYKIARLYFGDQIRSESSELIRSLKESGCEVFLVSGDQSSRVRWLGESLGIPGPQIFSETSPEQKLELVARLKSTCMIGDGANDALALKKADVGIAVKGSVDLSLQSADCYFTRGGLRPFFDLLAISKQTRRTLVRNLSISLIYNLVGGTLALLGYINPMIAAILMPTSSVIIVISSLWGQK